MSAVLKNSRPIWLLIAGCCTATLLFFIFEAALDIPFIDDYNALLDFIIQYLRTDSTEEKMHFIFRQHNEHRIVYARLMVLLDYYALGCTNLRHLIFFGSISLLLMTIIFCVEAFKYSKNILSIVPVILLSLHFQHMGSLLWATSALQNIGVASLACLAIWLLTRRGVFWQCMGVIFAFMTTFASGTGPFIWIVLFFIALMGRNVVKCIIIAASGTGSILLFFHSYRFPVTENTSITGRLAAMPEVILGVMGGTFDIHEKGTPLVPVVAGFLLMLMFTFCIARTGLAKLRKDPARQFLIGVFLFGLLSAIAISLGRGSYVENRYKVISTLCVLATYNMVLLQLSRERLETWLNVVSFACLGLWLLFFWRYYPEMLEYKSVRKADHLSMLNAPHNAHSPFRQRITALKKLGIKSADDAQIQQTFLSSGFKNDTGLPSPKILKKKNKYAIKWCDSLGLFKECYLVLRSDRGSFVFPVRKKMNSLSDFFRSGRFYTAEREVCISYDWIQKGRYTISVYLPDQTCFISLQDTIAIDKNVKPWLSFRWFNDAYAP